MIESRVRIEGVEQLQAALNNIGPAVQAAMQDVGHTMRALALGRTPVGIRKGHSGTLKRSWGGITFSSGGMSFGNVAPYAHVLELGLYPGEGPRTVEMDNGIFSRQAREGILGPLLDDPAVVQQITDTVANEIIRGINGVTRA